MSNLIFILAAVFVGWLFGSAQSQEITPNDYESSAVACYPNAGIKKISVNENGIATFCNNGAQFYVQKDKK